ncbi:MAG: GNAT family N-acetyltransferase, partial [Lachnospiraceae bacterium]|nr:GNAT family N-acetyltransferase [Lachnospiraceae bacterium]
MRLRPFEEKDFEVIKDWIPDERGHAMWCANRFQYPLDKNDFLTVLSDMAKKHGDSPYVVTMDDDVPDGFFCYSTNDETKEGMLKFVVVAPYRRGSGIAQEMFRVALSFAFEETKVNAVHLIVFSVNGRAKKFYEKVGFKERKTDHKAFVYKDEHWSRCNMIIRKDQRNGPIRRLPVCMVMIMFAALLLLTGCVSGEGEQKKPGRDLMNEYFQNAGKKASVETIYADVTRPDADRLEMSDYVKGTYRLGKDSYEFWANVETGSIYTSERLMEFGESVLKLQADRLGL